MEGQNILIPGSISSLPTIIYQSWHKEFVKISVSFPLHTVMQGLITRRGKHPCVMTGAVWPPEVAVLRSVPGTSQQRGADSRASIPACCRRARAAGPDE